MKKHQPPLSVKHKDGYLRRFDAFLVPRSHKLIVLGVMILILPGGLNATINFLIAVSFPVILLWLYLSCRKYGLVDTTEFLLLLPFLFVGALLSATGKISDKDAGEWRKVSFPSQVAESLSEAINEKYSGKIIEYYIDQGHVYVVVETPYGLQIPVDEIKARVAEKLHISPSLINHGDLSETKSYYLVSPSALKEQETYRKSLKDIETLVDIKERLLCQRKSGFSRK